LRRRYVHSYLTLAMETVTKTIGFEVSRRIREEFDKRSPLLSLHGASIIHLKPRSVVDLQPNVCALLWQHDENRYLGR